MALFKTGVVKQTIQKIESIKDEDDLVKIAEKLEEQKNKLKSGQQEKKNAI